MANPNATEPEFNRQLASNPSSYANQGQQYTNWNTQQQQFTSVPQNQPPPYSIELPSQPAYNPYGQAPPPVYNPYVTGSPTALPINGYVTTSSELGQQAISSRERARGRRNRAIKRIIMIRIAIGVVSIIVTITCGLIAYYSVQ